MLCCFRSNRAPVSMSVDVHNSQQKTIELNEVKEPAPLPENHQKKEREAAASEIAIEVLSSKKLSFVEYIKEKHKEEQEEQNSGYMD